MLGTLRRIAEALQSQRGRLAAAAAAHLAAAAAAPPRPCLAHAGAMAGRVLVAVKRVVDYNARIRVKPDKARWKLARLEQPRPALAARSSVGSHCSPGRAAWHPLIRPPAPLRCTCASAACRPAPPTALTMLRRAALRCAAPQSGVDLSSVKMSMNPFCEVRAFYHARAAGHSSDAHMLGSWAAPNC